MTQPDFTAQSGQHKRVRARLDKVAYWLDDCITIPGTRWKLGLEPIIGLVPLAGDLIGLLLSGYIILEAVRVGAPLRLTARMAVIALLDLLSGLVPVVGDIVDMAYKSNRRNAGLLIQYLDQREGRTPRHSRIKTLIWLALLASVIALLAWLTVQLYHLMT